MALHQVLFDYAGDPNDPEQLSLAAGDTLTVEGDAGSGWVYAVTAAGVRGIVPGGYVAPMADAAAERIESSAEHPPAAQEVITTTIAAPEPEPVEQEAPPPAVAAPAVDEQPAAEASTSSAPVSDPKYAKYEKMRKAGLPEGAIRHAMAKDNVDAGDFFGASGSGGSESASSQVQEVVDPRIEKYTKMQKAGLPEGAIRNAMMRDGVDASLMFGGPSEGVPAPKPLVIQKKSASPAAAGSNLNDALKGVQLKATPATPPKTVSQTTEATPNSQSSPFDEIKRRALERQHRVEATGSQLDDHHTEPRGGASYSPPDKTQWKPNLRSVKKDGGVADAPKVSPTPGWAALKKTTPPEAAMDAGKKRLYNDAEPSAAPIIRHERLPQPCNHYKLDTTAAQFGDCVCGHSKAAHEQSKATALPPGESKEAKEIVRSERSAQPCNQYRLDKTAAKFGECVCGHSKAAHEQSRAPTESMETKPTVVRHERSPQPCNQYKLDKSAAQFGDCVCGHSKAAHEQSNKPTTFATEPMVKVQRTKEPTPCSTYRVDVGAATFGDCVCGHPKIEHERASSSKPVVQLTEPSVPETPKRERAEKPCDKFTVDLRAKGFDICSCGHSRSEHVNSDAPTGATKSPLDHSRPLKEKREKGTEPCTKYEVDVSASDFDTCVCGFKKSEHGGKPSPKNAIPEQKPIQKSPSSSSEKTPEPCSNYRVDMRATAFGTCLCGHPKASHGKPGSSPQQKFTPLTTSEKKQDKAPKPCNSFKVDVTSPTFGTCVCGHHRSQHNGRQNESTNDKEKETESAGSVEVAQLPPSPASKQNSSTPAHEKQEDEPKPVAVSVSSLPAQEPGEQQAGESTASKEHLDQSHANPTTEGAESSTDTTAGESQAQGATKLPEEQPAQKDLFPRRAAPPPPAQSVAESVPPRSAPPPPGVGQKPLRAAPPPPAVGVSSQAPAPSFLRPPPPPPSGGGSVPATIHSTQASSTTSNFVPSRAAPPPPIGGYASVVAPPAVVPVQGQGYSQVNRPMTLPATSAPRQGPSVYSSSSQNTFAPPMAVSGGGVQAQQAPQYARPAGFGQYSNQGVQYSNQGVPPGQQKWMCSRCRCENEPTATQCLICELRRPDLQVNQPPPPPPAIARPPVIPAVPVHGPTANVVPAVPVRNPAPAVRAQTWNCERCTYENPSNVAACDVCRYPRPGPPTAAHLTAAQRAQGSGRNPFDPFW